MGQNRSWSDVTYCPSICMNRLRKTQTSQPGQLLSVGRLEAGTCIKFSSKILLQGFI